MDQETIDTISLVCKATEMSLSGLLNIVEDLLKRVEKLEEDDKKR